MPLDLGVGLLLGVLLDKISSLPYGVCLLIGLASSLLPDLDFILPYLKTRRQPDSSHRDGLHYPLIVVPIVGFLGYLIEPQIGLILALGCLLHFVHDSFGVGFGVKWLYPYKKNSYLFFYHAGLPTNKEMPRKKLHSWNDDQRKHMAEKFGDPDWIKNIYFRLHPFGVFEYAVLFVGIFAAMLNGL